MVRWWRQTSTGTMRRLASVVSLLSGCSWATTVGAQVAPPIQTNDYSVEFFQGPVLAPLRVTSMAGAYVAYAEGIDGLQGNPAAPAVREPFSFHYVDYDLDFSVQLPATFGSTDFDNDGQVGFYYDNFVFYNVGGMIQIGRFGVGVMGDTQWYDISPKGEQDAASASLNLRRFNLVGATSLWNHQVSVGVGARAVSLAIDTTAKDGTSDTAVSLFGWAPQAGLLLEPNDVPWRIGVSVRAPVDSAAGASTRFEQTDDQGVRRVVGLAVPASVHLPWEVRAGVAVQLGSRPLNPRWIDPLEQERKAWEALRFRRKQRAERVRALLRRIRDPKLRRVRAKSAEAHERALRAREEEQMRDLSRRLLAQRRARYWNWPREHILVLLEALVTGPSDHAVSLEGFLSQRETRVGKHATVTARLGFEGEPVVGLLKTRFGTYLEPARVEQGHARQHVTFGFDVHLFSSTFWDLFPRTHIRLSGLVDLAPRYQNMGLAVGSWH